MTSSDEASSPGVTRKPSSLVCQTKISCKDPVTKVVETVKPASKQQDQGSGRETNGGRTVLWPPRSKRTMTTSSVPETMAIYRKPGPQSEGLSDGSWTPRGDAALAAETRRRRYRSSGTLRTLPSAFQTPSGASHRLDQSERAGQGRWGRTAGWDTEQSRERRLTAHKLPSITKLPHDIPMVTRVQRLPSPWQQP